MAKWPSLELLGLSNTRMPVPMGADSTENVKNLVKDYLSHTLTKNELSIDAFDFNPRPSVLQGHVRHTVDALVGDSPEIFANLGEQLHITEENIHVIFIGISDEIFVTGINWGRVVAFLAFGGSVATHCASKESLIHLVPDIAEWMTDYIESNLTEWIKRHGDWDGFIRFFRLPGEQENLNGQLGLKNWSLYALAGFGVGAILMLAASQPHP